MRKPAAPPMPPIALHKLPRSLRVLIDAIGEGAAFELCKVRGGVPLVVPKRAGTAHAMSELIGARAWADLVRAFGGETIDVPKYDGVLRQVRHERVRMLRAAGLRIDQVAIQTGYTKRHVINILGSESWDLRQVGLFDEPGEADPAPAQAPKTTVRTPARSAHDPFGLVARPDPQRDPV